ncbi:hypothetical protein GUITHDRAFT_146507 [Guillardia theta CCMP2712]|uniref:Uncharacterized protein n=2 Tax=Guillardia theta TaxID=55529 RepID=L1IHW5_GUITC|nr:hypothetical protein GUITHDRAFT_146507 [Guillardia theta CCMP2712]EKX35400.1 hypothetical protein GUITHDRAFT_146507 [Guillardia theta CCMP2712]|mmetsp:Transcript_47073/g.147368  ORF Transcript_47073/g.147368 Transcript_47073/m.147368 type:complete len:106 (+) Transcript_47073:103-420(+)|eukprot:XP_005822380.1 hypothetical protein GUITHDRAFT_146507 [Guillardia theta CCMP2712]
MLRRLLLLTAAASVSAFLAAPALPRAQSLRTKAAGPVCLLSEGQMAVSIVGTKNDDLTVVQGRGDMRSKKGKRFAKSYGKCRTKSGKTSEKSKTPWGGVHGQPTS